MYNLNLSDKVKNSKEYKAVVHLIEILHRDGVFSRLEGNCIGACDLVTSMLLQHGVEASIVECSVSVKNNKTNPPTYHFIGFDKFSEGDQVDVHTVVVTSGEIPLLIDVSIASTLPQHTPVIITPIKNDQFVLAEAEIDNVTLRYNNKKNLKLPALHQKTILQKMKDDEDLKNKIKFIQTVVFFIIGFSITNFFLNIIAIILKIMNP